MAERCRGISKIAAGKGADTLPGFAVSDEKVKTKSTQKKLKSWLKKIDVKSRSAKAVPITIKIGRVTSSLSSFKNMGDSVKVTFDLKK